MTERKRTPAPTPQKNENRDNMSANLVVAHRTTGKRRAQNQRPVVGERYKTLYSLHFNYSNYDEKTFLCLSLPRNIRPYHRVTPTGNENVAANMSVAFKVLLASLVLCVSEWASHVGT